MKEFLEECWVNMYREFSIKYKVINGYPWATREDAIKQGYMGGRKLIYRIHIKLK